jgi:hypothetical protein
VPPPRSSPARLPGDYRTDVLILLPSMYLGVVLLAVLAPLAAGGGNELFPPDQLVAFPVRPSTQFLGGVLLAPLNLAWIAQVVVLVAASSYAGAVTGTGPWTIAMSLLFVGSATVAGHAVAWWVVGVRQAAVGRAVTWGVAAALAVSVAVLDRAGLLTEALDRAPTRGLVLAAVQGPSPRWWTTTLGWCSPRCSPPGRGPACAPGPCGVPATPAASTSRSSSRAAGRSGACSAR